MHLRAHARNREISSAICPCIWDCDPHSRSPRGMRNILTVISRYHDGQYISRREIGFAFFSLLLNSHRIPSHKMVHTFTVGDGSAAHRAALVVANNELVDIFTKHSARVT